MKNASAIMMSWWQPLRLSKSIKNLRTLVLVICLVGFVPGCKHATPSIPYSAVILDESPVQEIQLIGPVSKSRAEISGMAWCGENLILLPQYPKSMDENGREVLFKIPKADIDQYFTTDTPQGIEPLEVPFDSGELHEDIPGFEGFEAIVFHQKSFYVSIEARHGGEMMGYLVRGVVDGECEGLTLEKDTLVAVKPQADLGNMSDETLIIFEDQLYSIYEANGVNVNPDPVSHVFNLSLEAIWDIPLPNVEYRITDATAPDSRGEFWAINTFFPGDAKLKPAQDQVAVDFGIGMSHRDENQVERLLAFIITDNGIEQVDRLPVYLALSGNISRNWEGIVRYGDGFLLVTDLFPRTILAFLEDTILEE